MAMQIRRCWAAVLVAAGLSGCAGATGAPGIAVPPTAAPTEVARSTEQGGRFIALVGPREQHAEPFLGVPGTNIYALRSWIDTRTGTTVHQLYVSDSYAGAERDWNAAHDAQGKALRFIPISKNEITCERGCSYAEEFAATLPEPLLRQSEAGLTVAFSAKSGASKTIAVPGELIKKQLAAVDAARAGLSPSVIAGAAKP
jgi:hypothetical protein